MKIVESSVELVNAPSYETLLSTVEQAGRVCYKSEDKIAEGSAEKFVRNILSRGHEAVIEHGVITARIICDRGVSHEENQSKTQASHSGGRGESQAGCHVGGDTADVLPGVLYLD